MSLRPTRRPGGGAAHARAEEALRESRRQFATLVRNLPGMAYRGAADARRTMAFVSEGCRALTGYDPADLVGGRVASWGDLIVSEDREATAAGLAKALAERRPFELGYRIRSATGQLRWVVERGCGVWSPAEELLAVEGFVSDLTERRTLEEKLRQALKVEAVGRLAGGIAHDFNNLLTAVLGSTELLQHRLAADDSAQVELETIRRAALRAAEFTKGLLAFARRQVLDPVHLDLAAFVADAVPMLRHLIPESIRIDVRPTTATDAVQADRGQLTRILMNLCVNARDAMPDGGTITIETEGAVMDTAFVAAHLGAREGRYVCLRVADTGIGIKEESLEHIFEPFFTTKETGKGTGLGLSTVYGIVKQHEGFILATSEPSRGSVFTVFLPAVARGELPPAPAPEAPAAGGGEAILVVEDEPEVRHVLVQTLSGLGYAVHEAADGAAALAMLQGGLEVDLVLTDLVMPRMGGMGLYDAARRVAPDLRFLFSSGYADEAVQVGFIKKNGLAFLPKPYGIEELARKVRETLDSAAPAARPEPG